ncbi:MurR/RpiR family transcriptional regulator [Lactobacillus mulieris]|uniref:MurR/RpiR family transcriptional regulator n=1 Tax=Lactobacillus mulieris TaxID=2508708 RepID=UPI0022CE0329|nr:MurR/RpiR family transcriptional regulator [Lactobacillus mulieris]MCZ9599381.1 MurR/RpiR family transcriptional regulator [Lactobacillus mulieris]
MSTTELSNAEQHLWNIIQANPDKIIKMSIIQLSQFANVSTATVVRTLKKMGYNGFSSYREYLRLKKKATAKFDVINDADDKIKAVIIKNEVEMNNTLHNLSYNMIEDSIMMTRQASMVYIFCRGFSELIGQELMIKLQLTGKYVELHSDPNIIRTISKKINSRAIVIFITLNGQTKELVDSGKELAKHDVPTITFTTNAHGDILPYSTQAFIGYKSEINYFPDYEVRSRLPLQIMTRIFCDAYAVRISNLK